MSQGMNPEETPSPSPFDKPDLSEAEGLKAGSLPAGGGLSASDDADGPRVAVELASRAPTADPAIWDMAWDVHNLDSEPLRILGAWLPHGRFRSPRRTIDPPLGLE